MYKCNAATCVDVYQAALMRRGTPKHACLQIVLYIYIYINGTNLVLRQSRICSFSFKFFDIRCAS